MPTNTIAVKFPLEINEETGSFTVYNQSELQSVVEQNIKMVLLTNPGEKIFNNDFGVGLKRYLFLTPTEIANGASGDQNLPSLKPYIRKQLETYVSYITIEEIHISIAQSLMNVKFRYYLNNSPTASEFDLTISDVSL